MTKNLTASNSYPILVIIAGATASGKSETAISVAEKINGEIVNLDSRQVYRGMEIGTAQPDAAQQKKVPHHLYGFLAPEKQNNVVQHLNYVKTAVAAIWSRGKIPVAVGGTGLYLKALTHGLSPLPQTDPQLRAELILWTEKNGKPALYQRLKKLDPETAGSIDSKNWHRVLRAVEICILSGEKASRLKDRHELILPEGTRFLCFLLARERQVLKESIRQRCQKIWPHLVEELKCLQHSVPRGSPALSSVGYSLAAEYLQNPQRQKESEWLDQFYQQTWQYAKRQITWFKKEAHYIVVREPYSENIIKEIATELSSKK